MWTLTLGHKLPPLPPAQLPGLSAQDPERSPPLPPLPLSPEPPFELNALPCAEGIGPERQRKLSSVERAETLESDWPGLYFEQEWGGQSWYLDQEWGWQFTLVRCPRHRSYRTTQP